MNQPDPPISPETLEKRLKAARKAHEGEAAGRPPGAASYGMRVGLDLVSGVCVGTAVGYGLDRWLGTLPWLMLIGMALGTAAGVRLMMETSRRAVQALEQEETENNG